MADYANDHDDVLPLAAWNDALAPYNTVTSASLRCPSLPDGSFGYAYNVALPGVSVNTISDLDATPLLFDSVVTTADVTDSYSSASPQRHGGRNTVFLSGRLDPVLSEVTTPAEVRATCVDQLHRIGIAFAIYANDYDDNLPASAWNDSLTPYVALNSVVFRCPAVASGSYGYAMNQALLGVSTPTISSPSTVPLAFDSSILTRNATSTYLLANPPRHGGSNVVYADSHASGAP